MSEFLRQQRLEAEAAADQKAKAELEKRRRQHHKDIATTLQEVYGRKVKLDHQGNIREVDGEHLGYDFRTCESTPKRYPRNAPRTLYFVVDGRTYREGKDHKVNLKAIAETINALVKERTAAAKVHEVRQRRTRENTTIADTLNRDLGLHYGSPCCAKVDRDGYLTVELRAGKCPTAREARLLLEAILTVYPTNLEQD